MSVFAAGCATAGTQQARLPGPVWPEARPRTPPAPVNPLTRFPATPAPAPLPAPAAASGGSDIAAALGAVPRENWAKAKPLSARINPMGQVQRITVHHEGWTPVWFTDYNSTAQRLEQIRKSHLDRLRAGDIGYHFVIDRSGKIWEGRDIRHQGAHVRDNNEHNIGVMVLGNFEIQSPTQAQMDKLVPTLRTLMQTYKVPVKRVYTHRELNPTDCPGKSLQPRMVSLRKGRSLVA